MTHSHSLVVIVAWRAPRPPVGCSWRHLPHAVQVLSFVACLDVELSLATLLHLGDDVCELLGGLVELVHKVDGEDPLRITGRGAQPWVC